MNRWGGAPLSLRAPRGKNSFSPWLQAGRASLIITRGARLRLHVFFRRQDAMISCPNPHPGSKTMRTLAGIALTVLVMSAVAGSAVAQVYKWVDEHGKMHISDQPRPDAGEMDVLQQRPGPQGPQTAQGKATVFGEWYPSSQRFSRAQAVAEEYLNTTEGWQETPDLKGYHTQHINNNLLTILFHVPIPKSHFAGTSCTSGYQMVGVKTEIDMEDQSRSRILGVELGSRNLHPNRCN